MAENKKSFVMYCDQRGVFEPLPPEMCKKLLMHLFSYVNDENPQTDDAILIALFSTIKNQLKRDLIKWESRANTSRENGKLGGRPKTQTNPDKPSGLNNNPDEPTEPVNVNVNVNENVSDTVNVNVIKENKSEKVFSSTVSDCYYKIKDFFPLDVIPKDQKSLDKWMDCIRLLTEADGFTTEQIEFVVKKYTRDDFWSGNFQSLLKLRKKNKDGIQYMVYFKNQIIKEKDNGKNSKGDQLREVMELLGH